jgi:hypothetical protein
VKLRWMPDWGQSFFFLFIRAVPNISGLQATRFRMSFELAAVSGWIPFPSHMYNA